MTVDLHSDVFIDFERFYDLVQGAQLTAMPTFQQTVDPALALRASPGVDYKSHYFISHRWDDPKSPDASLWQFEALRQFASELRANGRFPSCFWYDYSCLPQKPRTPAEEAIFQAGLPRLNQLSIDCETVLLVSGTAGPFDDLELQLKRGWILCEIVVARLSGKWTHWFHQSDADIFAAARRRTIDFNTAVDDAIRDMPVYDRTVLLDWLKGEGIKCTNEADLEFLAGRMVEFSFDIHRVKPMPPLAKGTVHRLSAAQVAAYWIHPSGRSPYFPDCTITWTVLPNGDYEIELH